MGDKRRTGRTASVGNDARVLMELLTGFIDAAAALEGDALLRDAMADWTAHVKGEIVTCVHAAGLDGPATPRCWRPLPRPLLPEFSTPVTMRPPPWAG